MTVGELRQLLVQLGTCDIPDDAPVLILDGDKLLGCYAEVMPLPERDRIEQTQPKPDNKALVFRDERTG